MAPPSHHPQPRHRRHRRSFGRAALAFVIALAAVLFAVPGRALAHAELVSTDPTAGAVLDTSPSVVTLEFTEPVEVGLGAVSLYDGAGIPVEVGDAEHPDGRSTAVQVSLPELAPGSYVVDWRVVSADSHPIQGAFTFQVGSVSDLAPGAVESILSRGHTGRVSSIGLDVTRGLVTAAIAVVFGGLLVIGLGIVEASRRNRRIVLIGAVIGLAAGLLQLPFEVGYASDRGLGVIVDGDAWRIALETRIGTAWFVRALILGVFGVGLALLLQHCRQLWWRVLVVLGLIGVGVASAYSGHGATGRWHLAGIVDTVVHVGAMGVWLGGLVLLLFNVRSIGISEVRRYSTLAFIMMTLIVISGVLQAVRQVGSIDALTETRYGTILIWKLVFVALVLIVAAVSRQIVRRDPLDRPRLGRAIAIEVVIAVAIVTATSLLMAANPSLAATAKPFSAQLVDNGYIASITIEPGKVGPNEMHIYLSNPNSSLIEPDEVKVEISDPGRDLAPIPVPVTRSGASHYTASAITFPYAATWTMTITARYNTFDAVSFTTDVPIG